MSEEKCIVFRERFGTVTIRERGPVTIPERDFGTVRFVEKNVTFPERILTDPVRIVGQEYEFIEQLAISNFSFYQIGLTAAIVEYSTNKDAKCKIYHRKETPLGDWVLSSYESSFHTDHLHLVPSAAPWLEAGTWYHLYIYAYDEDGTNDNYPGFPPYYHRFKTGTRTDPGEDDGVQGG